MKPLTSGFLLLAVTFCVLLPLCAQERQQPFLKKPPQTWVIRVLYLADTGTLGSPTPREHLLWLSRQPEEEPDWKGRPQAAVQVDLPLTGYKSLSSPELRQRLSQLPEGSLVVVDWPKIRTAPAETWDGGVNSHNDFYAFCQREKLLFQVTPK